MIVPQRSWRVLRELARAQFDEGQGVPEDRLDFVVREISDIVAHAGWMAQLAVRVSLAFLQLLGPVLLLRRFRRFTWMSPAERLLYLERVEHSLFAVLLVAVKFYLGMVYFEHPDAVAITGYDGKGLRAREDALPASALLSGPAREAQR